MINTAGVLGGVVALVNCIVAYNCFKFKDGKFYAWANIVMAVVYVCLNLSS